MVHKCDPWGRARPSTGGGRQTPALAPLSSRDPGVCGGAWRGGGHLLCLQRAGMKGEGEGPVSHRVSSLGLKAGEPLLRTVPCLAVYWRPRTGGAGGPRAVVMGWGLMRETDCLKRDGDHPLGNRPKKPSLFFDCVSHPPIVHLPRVPQEFYRSGACGQGIGPSQTPRAGHVFCSGYAAYTSTHRSLSPMPSLVIIAVLRWLEGTWAQHVQLGWANTTCQDARAWVAHMGKMLDVFPPLVAINTLSLEPLEGCE